MNKISRSFTLKVSAFLLSIASLCSTIIIIGNTLLINDNCYMFEKNFYKSDKFLWAVNSAASLADAAVANLLNGNAADQNLERNLKQFPIEYYIKVDDFVVTNNNNDDKKYYSNYAYVIENDFCDISDYDSPRWNNPPDKDIKVLIKPTDEYVQRFEIDWNNDKNKLSHAIYWVTALLAFSLVAVVYLLFVCGRKSGDDEIHTLLIDRMYVEVNLCLTVLSVIGFGFCIYNCIRLIENEYFAYSINFLSIVTAIEAAVLITLITSLVRNMKNKTFFKRSLIKTIICFIWKAIKSILKFIGKIMAAFKNMIIVLCAKKYGRIILLLITLYSVALCILFFGMCLDLNNLMFFILIVTLYTTSCMFISKHIKAMDLIKTAIFEIKNGNLEYRIYNCPKGLLSDTADAVNSIGDGLSASLEKEIKAERLKSELITNVSHDLKTPLTSIINYADLLCREELEPEEANDYAKIIQQKSLKLKDLTSDLFDISKIQSGNESINLERLDVCLLLSQILGELDEKINSSNISFVTSIPENEIFASADGKKLSRVFENLINNAIKYSLNGTRVYISINEERNNNIQIEFKNISAYPMYFDGDEITERFARGDSSRTTEGSGLGLAIAKGYVEACGGTLKITTDGDLFKVSILLVKAKTEFYSSDT